MMNRPEQAGVRRNAPLLVELDSLRQRLLNLFSDVDAVFSRLRKRGVVSRSEQNPCFILD